MKIEQEILINQYGQDVVPSSELLNLLELLTVSEKKALLNDIVYLILQSKPETNDIPQAIIDSKLKPTYTPCILLKNGVANHNLQKIINLPESESKKSFTLLLSLFKIAYQRRFEKEKNVSDKWWYSDLSDNLNVDKIRRQGGGNLVT